MNRETQEKAAILVQALPYIRQYAGKCILIKVGGEIIDDPEGLRSFAEDLILLKSVGVKVVLCHGGGPQITRMMKAVGKEAVFADGLRVTDRETLEITMMVLLGQLNAAIVSALNVHGPHAVGLSGIDGRLFLVEQKNPALGFVGEINQVNPEVVSRLLEANTLPVIASIGTDEQGQAFNLNADTIAGELAKALQAEKLILLTNVEGIYRDFNDKQSLISEIDDRDLAKMQTSGSLHTGMLPKVEAVLTALRGGVSRAHLIDGRVRHALLLEVFTPEGVGTMITQTGSN